MKKQFDTNKYIKIPFLDRGRDFLGCDCWGLVRLVYTIEYDTVLPSFVDMYASSSEGEEVAKAVIEGKQVIKVIQKDSPEYGDVVVFNMKGFPSHVGVYIGKGMVLHIMRDTHSCCERINVGRLKGRVEGYYEIK